jgi:hypothetical protein
VSWCGHGKRPSRTSCGHVIELISDLVRLRLGGIARSFFREDGPKDSRMAGEAAEEV